MLLCWPSPSAFPFVFLSGQKKIKCWHELHLKTVFEQVPSNIYYHPINRYGVIMTGSDLAAHSVGYNLVDNKCHHGNRSVWGWTSSPKNILNLFEPFKDAHLQLQESLEGTFCDQLRKVLQAVMGWGVS